MLLQIQRGPVLRLLKKVVGSLGLLLGYDEGLQLDQQRIVEKYNLKLLSQDLVLPLLVVHRQPSLKRG